MPNKFLFLLFIPASILSQSMNYYFGNLHAHTGFSDGNRDSMATLVNTPAKSFAYARLSQDFDFLGISEHNHYSTVHNPGFKRPRYAEGLAMADSMNEDGKFLCLYGLEYGVSSTNNGHVIIYGFNQLLGWESNVGGITGPNYDLYNAKSDYGSLFDKIKKNPGAFAYLAHPYWTDFCTDGTDSSALAFAKYNAGFDSAIVGIPLRSGNAFSTFSNYSDYVPTEYFNYYKKMLHNGYHLGMGYDHDNHYTNFGRSNGGRLVLMMPSLTRANLYDALQQMHFYGSDDSNAKLKFELNGAMMGSSVNSDQFPAISVVHDDPDGELADTIRIWKGWRTSSAWAYTVQTITSANSASYYDTQVQKGQEYYYFCDVRQKDGQWMVSSPVWYTGSATLGLSIGQGWDCRIFPQPASGEVNLIFDRPANRKITVMDATGNLLFCCQSAGMQEKLRLEMMPEGLYFVEVEEGMLKSRYKLIISPKLGAGDH